MEIDAIHRRVIGLDVHQASVVARAIIREDEGTTTLVRKRFGTFERTRGRRIATIKAACAFQVRHKSQVIRSNCKRAIIAC